MNTPAGVSGKTGLLERLRHARASERVAVLTAHLQAELRRALSLADPVSPHVGFFELGMDSLTAVGLRDRLHEELGGALFLSPTLLFDYPTVGKLAAHLAEEVLGVGPARTTTPAEAAGGLHQATEGELDALLETHWRRHP
jgi:hypothetical protein